MPTHQACKIKQGVRHASEKTNGKETHVHALNAVLNAADRAAVGSGREIFVQLRGPLVLQACSTRRPIRRELTYGSANAPAEGPPPNFTVVVEDGVLGSG